MGISVVVRDERGNALSGSPLSYKMLVSLDQRAEFPILGHVDPFGRTMFNREQVKTLEAELEALESGGVEASARELIARLRQLCELTCERRHRYLWFLGD